jgi:hypothetical protein
MKKLVNKKKNEISDFEDFNLGKRMEKSIDQSTSSTG